MYRHHRGARTYTYRGDSTDHLAFTSVSTEIVNSTVFGVPFSHACAIDGGQPAIVLVFIAAIILMVVLVYSMRPVLLAQHAHFMGDNPIN